MKSVGFFVFGECEIYKRDKVKIRLSFYICTMHRRRKYIRCPEGRSSFGSGFPIGASSIPVGTRFSVGKSSVLYLCGADGSRNCSTPWKVRLQLRRSGGKGCPLRGSISDRKRLAGGASMHCLPAVSSAEQRYIKAPSAAAYYRIRTTTAVSRAGCPSPLPPPSLSGSRSNENGVLLQSASARFHR